MTLGVVAQPLADELLTTESVQVAVHDASRLGWSVTVPAPETGQLEYMLELELEIPTALIGSVDLWSAFQADARLDAAEDDGASTKDGFRRAVVGVSVRLARARDGFIRHATLMRSEPTAEENHVRALALWVGAARETLARARDSLLSRTDVGHVELALADEFLSGRLWTVLTDCTRSLRELEQAFESRTVANAPSNFDTAEQAIADAVSDEIAYRREHAIANAEPVNALQLDRLGTRLRWLKKHFEQVLMLERETYEVVSRASGWLSGAAAILAYLWFFVVQTVFEHRTATVGWGFVVFGLISALAYASRDRLKELGKDWLAGRVQRMFAQRVTRYRPPTTTAHRYAPIVVARESFSRSARQSGGIDDELFQDVTVVRFSHRGQVIRTEMPKAWNSPRVRLFFRLDLSGVLPRMKDAVRGFVTPDRTTGQLAIIDVARNYELPISVRFHHVGKSEEVRRVLMVNKNGLVRVCEATG